MQPSNKVIVTAATKKGGEGMQQAAPTSDGTFRALRKVHLALLVSVVLYIWVAEKVLQHNQPVPDRFIVTAIGLLAAVMVVAAIAVRTKMTQPALDILQTNPDDKSSIVRWRIGSILSYVLAETVVLFGVALRILGATLAEVAAFYTAAIVLMLFLRPRQP